LNKKYFIIIISLSLFLTISSIFVYNIYYKKSEIEMSYTDFLQAVENKDVISVSFINNDVDLKIKLTSNDKKAYLVSNPKTEDFIEFLLLNDIKVNHNIESLQTQLSKVIIIIVIFAAIFFSIKKGNNTGFMVQNKNNESNTNKITLKNVAGNIEAKSMVNDIINFIKNPDKYSEVGARMPKGLLFYGPPGTGKTLMAKAIAGEAGVAFYSMSGSDFVQMYVGVGASRIRSLFKKAKKSEKAIIFIDEIDAIGKKRARNSSASNDERDQTLNALLTEMSGFNENDGILVIGATNRLDTLDEALLRPGRFDRQVEIGLPDINARKHILSLYTRSKPIADDVDIDALAKSTVYFSGAMLENLINEAAILTANNNKNVIDQENIDKAFYTVIAGAPKEDRSYITEKDKEITAYHEAGHALMTKLVLPNHYISKVTIIPSVRGAGGFNLSIPKDTQFQNKSDILANIMMFLGGRAAEDLIFGMDNITTGASNDIQKASTMIYEYINKFGMDNDLGLFSMEILEHNSDSKLISKCRSEINKLYKETYDLLLENKNILINIANELLDKESLNSDDIARIFNSSY